jgi:hypothetical protein
LREHRENIMTNLQGAFYSHLLPEPEAAAPPCLSLYQPTHRHYPDTQQNPIRFRNLVRVLETSLREKYANKDIRALLEPFHRLSDDSAFWIHQRDGLAVLATSSLFRVYRLQRPVPELAVVADSFHTKPLLRILQSADYFHVLALDAAQMRLFEGNRDAVDEVELPDAVPTRVTDVIGEREPTPSDVAVTVSAGASGGVGIYQGSGEKDETRSATERFFRAVDRAILERYSRPSGVPLILAALPEHHTTFRRISRNPALIDEGINIHPGGLTVEMLRERAWQVVEPSYLGRLTALTEEFRAAQPRDLASDDLASVAEAAVMGRVGTLLIEAEREVPGRIDASTGRVAFAELADPEVDDTLDDLAELVLNAGGRVVVVPAARMPSTTGVVAIYRF